MAIIFAPQVRSVQPAFEYNVTDGGVVNIYFSLSSYNSINDVAGVNVTVINPRVSAGAASYYICKDIYIAKSAWQTDSLKQTGEYYIQVTSAILRNLTLDQYYQVQLTFKNGSTLSEPSQMSLIKPIPYSDGVVTLDPKTRTVAGSITYDVVSKETLKFYTIEIIEDGKSAYISKTIDNNHYGLNFSTVVDYYFKEGSTYVAKVNYTTINNFNKTLTSPAQVVQAEAAQPWSDVTVMLSDDENGGGIHIEISSSLKVEGKIRIQRASEESSFRAWETATSLTIKNAFIQGYIVSWNDYFVEGGKIYQYRIYFDTNDGKKYVTSGHYYSPSFGDIFLSTTERQLAIRYNPNISGYKWVVQESITNTLGSKYPLIRRNAKTKYRQFTLSGTIYIDPSDITQNATDSCGNSMSIWWNDTQSSLFVNHSELFEFDRDIEDLKDYLKEERIYEKRFREMAMNFLSDGQVKLFRSFQEGNIIVYLSNVSFTPNKQLDRRVYDFSATVTELCEATEENMLKYRIYKPMTAYRYVLRSLGNDPEYEFSPYISVDQMFGSNAFIVEYEELQGV